MIKPLVFIGLLGYWVIGLFGTVWADECNPSCSSEAECRRKIEECTKLLQISAQATKPHEEKALALERDINALETNIKSLKAQVAKKKDTIVKREASFASRRNLLDAQMRDFYKRNWTSGLEYFLVTVFGSNDAGETLRALAYRQSLIAQDRKLIISLALEISDLNLQKKKLEETQSWLAEKQKGLEITLSPVKDLVNRAKSYQQTLSQTVGTLTARQQQLLAEKTGNFSTSVGDVPDTQDANSSIEGFKNNAPGGSFAGFSFGAPHRKGMSQYGAYGRAKSGQGAEDILRAYYGGIEIKKDYSTGINITVQGYGSYNLEEYVKRIYEVPNSWGDSGGYEALKAQAVAARSYALAYTGNGSRSICATESCQVFQPNPKGGNWERAVNDTRGWVLVSGGQPFSAWYAAASGGYTNSYSAQGHSTPGGWDTKCASQSCWTNDAYEKIASSPWFYKAWYKPRFRPASRPNAWLSKDEFVDIVNAALLFQKDNGALSHLSQTDKANADTWSKDEVKNKLGGEAVSEVSSLSASYSTGGYTNSVTLYTDKGEKNISGEIFRQIFNIRAPGEIWLASALFNIEKK